MSAREQILGRVREALAPLPSRAPLPDVPASLFDPINPSRTTAPVIAKSSAPAAGSPALGDWDEFVIRLRSVSGTPLASPAELFALLTAGGYRVGYCDPKLWPVLQPYAPLDITVHTSFDRTKVDEYTFGITVADGAIAATGTVILSDGGTASRLGALAPWVHIAVVPRDRVYRDLAAAIAALPRDPNVIWVTGPSKTADVEGILIEGVHGPGVQAAMLMPV